MSGPITPHLVLGGARSGKSTFAERLVESFPPPYLYVATAQVLDEEMEQRVAVHRERRGSQWRTLECPLNLVALLSEQTNHRIPILVDCLTLWLSNLLTEKGEESARWHVDRLRDLIPQMQNPLVLVSNEVGLGIVPVNALARAYRDLAGWANQQIASACRGVTFMVAGMPLPLKPRSS